MVGVGGGGEKRGTVKGGRRARYTCRGRGSRGERELGREMVVNIWKWSERINHSNCF